MKFAESTTTINTNAVFDETVTMTVDKSFDSHVIKALTDQYTDAELAASREYISNGLDASIEAMGLTDLTNVVLDKPVEVTVPSVLNPEFVVQDFGTGMTRDILVNVFPKYGASTKRDTNTQIGGFGFGAKAALAACSSFVVVSVCNGLKNTAIVEKNTDGIGEMKFLPEVATEEPNGTKVSMVLKNLNRMGEIFRDSNLLLGFPSKSILVNGKLVENSVYNTNLYTPIDGGWFANRMIDATAPEPTLSNRSLTVLVGPISYKVPLSKMNTTDVTYRDKAFDRSIVLNLPIGSVDMTPSRDTLIFSERTQSVIAAAHEKVTNNLTAHLQNLVDTAETRKAAFAMVNVMRERIYIFDDSTKWMYEGEEIPDAKIPAPTNPEHMSWASTNASKTTPKRVVAWNTPPSKNSIVITDVKDADEAKKLNRFRNIFLSKLENCGSVFYFTESSQEGLHSWTSDLVKVVMTATEFTEMGAAFRKEHNAALREARSASRTSTAISYGSVPISILDNRYSSNERPSVASAYAADVASAKKVVFMRIDNDATDTFTHKFAAAMSGRYETGTELSAMTTSMAMILKHSGVEDNELKFVRIPANTKVETFLKVVPHAITFDEAIADSAKRFLETLKEDKFAYGMALTHGECDFSSHWVMNVTKDDVETIASEEVKQWVVNMRKVAKAQADYVVRNKFQSNYRIIQSSLLNDFFKEFIQELLTTQNVEMPLLGKLRLYRDDKSMSGMIAEYINLKFPAVTAK